jgi:hypothetical protein
MQRSHGAFKGGGHIRTMILVNLKIVYAAQRHNRKNTQITKSGIQVAMCWFGPAGRSDSPFFSFIFRTFGNAPCMNSKELSNYQLFALLQNRRLHSSIKEPLQVEWGRRQLTPEQVQELAARYTIHYPPDDGEGLPLRNKLFLVLVPAVFMYQILRATRHLASNQRRKWKDFWLYVSLGYLVWTVVIVLMVKLLRR